MLEQVRGIALGAAALGLARGDTAVVIGENEPEHYWALFAAQSLGAKTVSVYPDATADELHYLCEDSQAPGSSSRRTRSRSTRRWRWRRGCPTSSASPTGTTRACGRTGTTCCTPSRALAAAGREEHRRHPQRFEREVEAGGLDDLALLTYTSGTTSKPKGVMISHRWLIDNAERMRSALPVEPGMEYLSYTPLAWITEQLLGVTLGLTLPLVVNFPEGPDQVLPNLRELAPHMVLFGPRQWESIAATIEARMLDAGWLSRRIYRWGVRIGHDVHVARLEGRPAPALSRLLLPLAELLTLHAVRDQFGFLRSKIAVSGGTAMAPDVFRLFHALGVPLRNLYGCSEFGLIAGHRGERYDLETVGPLLDVDPVFGAPLEARIEDSGELLLRGGTGFLGYWHQPEKTAALDRDGWFASGDAVRRTERGELVFLDRVEHLRQARQRPPVPAAVHRDPAALLALHQGRDGARRRHPALGRRTDQHRHGRGRTLGRGAPHRVLDLHRPVAAAGDPRPGARRDRAHQRAAAGGVARRALRQLPEGTGRRRRRTHAHAQAAPRVPRDSATTR